MSSPKHFVEVILPLSLPGTFTYHSTTETIKQLTSGKRVVVSFGTGKLYTGIVHQTHTKKPERYKTKPIQTVLDDQPLITETQIRFWEWIAKYYFCSLGDVYRNVFPTALRLESESFIQRIEGVEVEFNQLSDKAFLIYEALQLKGLISVKEAAQILDLQNAIPTIKELFDFGLIQMKEQLIEKYKPKIQNFISVPETVLKDSTFVSETLKTLTRAPKQREAFLQLIAEQNQTKKAVKASEFVKKHQINYSILKSLAGKKLIEIQEKGVERVSQQELETYSLPMLTFAQKQAFKQIKEEFKTKSTVLLQGVTSSGKTEIYIRLIAQALKENQKVLYLLPEIGLTTQLLARLKHYFGKKIGVYHSKFNQNERVELWNKTLNGDYDIIIGPRSALFLPFHPTLIVIDEEHENSFKQSDKKPFYNARDAALVLAKLNQANTLLGSATPSLETIYNVKQRKYGRVRLEERYGKTESPEVVLIDLKESYQKNQITGNISHQLKKEIEEQLQNKNQVIIFQNRRGYAPVLNCLSCGHTVGCPNCSVSLTLHKSHRQLKCHYCGYKEYVPKKCSNCESSELSTKGVGTEQVNDELQSMFPTASIARMDQDSMRKKHAYEKTLEAFENQEIDILVGTQMVTKGLDFSRVLLVAVIRADALLSFPDFRATEKAFQQLVQVAGRAGRREQRGKVMIQSFVTDSPVIKNVLTYDYDKNAHEILEERKKFLYPPFTKVIQIQFRHKSQERVIKAANQLVKLLSPYFNDQQLLGPEAPSIERVRNQFIQTVMLKIKEEQSPKKIKEILQSKIDTLNTVNVFRSVKMKVEVDF